MKRNKLGIVAHTFNLRKSIMIINFFLKKVSQGKDFQGIIHTSEISRNEINFSQRTEAIY